MSVSESIATRTSSAISASFMLAPIGNGHARGIRVVEGGFMGARVGARGVRRSLSPLQKGAPGVRGVLRDRKSTRLNSSHQIMSYAVFCLKKNRKASNHS